MIRAALALALPLTVAVSLSAPAAAQVSNAYVQVHGGLFVQTGDALSFDVFSPGGDGPDRASAEIDPDLGFAVGALVGYDVALGVSVEVEATLRSNDAGFDDAAGLGNTELGEEETLAVMLNGVYTFDVPFLADPYVGAGIGYAKPSGDVDAFDGAFAYQAKAGLLWPVGVGGIVTEASYFATTGLENEQNGIELDYGGVSATVGYRFKF